jgi:hypothetical protein
MKRLRNIYIPRLTDTLSYLEFLINDEPPSRWYECNSLGRFFEILSIFKETDIPVDLKSYFPKIDFGKAGFSKLDYSAVIQFLEFCWSKFLRSR